MGIFIDIQASKEAIIGAGYCNFPEHLQYSRNNIGCALIHHVLAAAAGLIKPETLPPTEGAAAQHSLWACLQTQDRMLLQSMSLDPSHYGWRVGAQGYEPVPTLDPMAPAELLQFMNCNCKGDCGNHRCSCNKNGVKCISACGSCKGITCKNGTYDDVQSGEDSDLDS